MVDFPRFQLADFEDPPVVETVLSVQFERLTAVQTVHLGVFWHRVKHRFPKTEERPALPQAVERFPGSDTRGARILFEAVEIPIPPRVLLLNSEGSEMIQLQNDRFVKNWRKADDMGQYPHYEPVIRPGFERDLGEFQSFVKEEKLGEIKSESVRGNVCQSHCQRRGSGRIRRYKQSLRVLAPDTISARKSRGRNCSSSVSHPRRSRSPDRPIACRCAAGHARQRQPADVRHESYSAWTIRLGLGLLRHRQEMDRQVIRAANHGGDAPDLEEDVGHGGCTHFL